MKTFRRFAWILSLSFLLISADLFGSSAFATEILLEPATIQRPVGGKARVRIYATSAVDLISMGVKLSFDPAVSQATGCSKYEAFDDGWLMDGDGNSATTNDQYKLPLVEIDNENGTVRMIGGRLIGTSTTGLSGKVLLGWIDFTAVGSGESALTVDLAKYHPNHPAKKFDNFVRLSGQVDEPENLPEVLGYIYAGSDACECDLNSDKSCNILDYQLFIQKWGSKTCHDAKTFCACDLNNDGSCNILDYQIFIQKWGSKTCHDFP